MTAKLLLDPLGPDHEQLVRTGRVRRENLAIPKHFARNYCLHAQSSVSAGPGVTSGRSAPVAATRFTIKKTNRVDYYRGEFRQLCCPTITDEFAQEIDG